MSGEIKKIGNWSFDVSRGLQSALAATVAICGKSMDEACKQAIIFMAQTAKNITPKAPLKRPVASDVATKSEYIEVFGKRGDISRIFKFMFSKKYKNTNPDSPQGTWAQAQRIKGRGLASRSWMFGLKNLIGSDETRRVKSGIARMFTVKNEKQIGYILQVALKYILKIMPAGWESTVKSAAENRILHIAAKKLESKWKSEMRRDFRRGSGLSKYLTSA